LQKFFTPREIDRTPASWHCCVWPSKRRSAAGDRGASNTTNRPPVSSARRDSPAW